MAIKRKNLTVEGHAVSAIIGVILMVAITVAIAAAVYYYVLPMMVSPGDTAPNIAWDTNTIDNKISITTGATGFTYASTSDGITTANLAFRTATNTYYLDSNLNLQLSSSFNPNDPAGWATGSINSGDIITGFLDGQTYSMVWIPLDTTIGPIEM